jgi:hypothetical protein
VNRIHQSCSGILTVITGITLIALLAGCGAEQLGSNFAGSGTVGPITTPITPGTTGSGTGTTTGSGGGTTGGGTGSGTGSTPGPTSTNGIPNSSHVVLVIEENHMFTEIFPNGMPWLVAQGNKYGYTLNYHANSSGSMLDYLWLSSGSCHAKDANDDPRNNDCGPALRPAGTNNFGCNGDGCSVGVLNAQNPATGNHITDDNIFRRLNAAGLTWKVYAESLPPGVDPTTVYESGSYVARHNPAVYYSDIYTIPNMKQNIVPFTQLAVDLANNQLPNYSIIIPNVDNDAHDGSIGQADAWLSRNVAPVLNHPSFQTGGDGLMFITFDECDAAAGGDCNGDTERVFTAVIGPKVKPGTKSTTSYKHESTLRTILDAFGITIYPGAAATTSEMKDFF